MDEIFQLKDIKCNYHINVYFFLLSTALNYLIQFNIKAFTLIFYFKIVKLLNFRFIKKKSRKKTLKVV